MNQRMILRLYRSLLQLYPDRFRQRYALEMEEVFSQAIAEAQQQGPAALRDLYLRELWGLPGSILRTYSQERICQLGRGRQGATGEIPLSRRGTLAAILAFVLPMLFIFLNLSPSTNKPINIAIILSLIVLTFLAGLIKGLPRWSMPYFGYVLAITAYVILSNRLVDLISPAMRQTLPELPLHASFQPLQEVFYAGLTWLGLLVLTLLAIGGILRLRRYQPFSQRLEHDWTLVPFILFAEAVVVFIILGTKNQWAIDAQPERPFLVASLFLLGSGAWIYLRSPSAWQRLAALLASLSLAICMAGIGKWAPALLMLWQQDPGKPSWTAPAWDASWQLTAHWGWMICTLLISILLQRLFFQPRQMSSPPGAS